MYVIETERLRLRPMHDADLDNMAALLGDPEVMRFYPAPKSRTEARGWIRWNERNYAEYGFGLWVIETMDGTFVGDCGITWQLVDGVRDIEVGYHVLPVFQGQGLATEAALASKDFARRAGARRLIAIIDPDNVPSQRVAEKIGLAFEKTAVVHGKPEHIYATQL